MPAQPMSNLKSRALLPVFDKRVVEAVASAVALAAYEAEAFPGVAENLTPRGRNVTICDDCSHGG